MTKVAKISKLLKKLVIKAIVYFRGVTFYETDLVPKSNSYKKLEIETVHGHEVNFFFYEEEMNDIRYKYGYFKHSKTKVCLLQAAFDDKMPPLIKKYNNLKIMIDKGDFLFDDDELIADVLMTAYLDFILAKEKVLPASLDLYQR